MTFNLVNKFSVVGSNELLKELIIVKRISFIVIFTLMTLLFQKSNYAVIVLLCRGVKITNH